MSLENYEEIGDVLFSHPIGSELSGTRTSGSDFDRLHICTSVSGFSLVNIPIKFNAVQSITPKLSNNTLIDDNYHWTGHYTVGQIVNIRNFDAALFGKVINHLAAIKFNKIDDVKDPVILEKYTQWLKSPMLGTEFWKNFTDCVNLSMMGLPDLENNWSQPVGELTDKLKKSKECWDRAGECRWPEIKSGLGYDPALSAKLLYTTLLATNILKNSSEILTKEEQEFIIDLKCENIGYASYKKQKSLILHRFQEITNRSYLLGYGDSVEQSKKIKTFGLNGIMNILEIFQKI
jgi:hypothetical protein